MEIRLLNTFVAVAKSNNFTHAAVQLNYAQSSVTSQIQALESELGVKLFERLGKSVSLTPEGDRLLPYAKQILQLCDEARSVVAPTDTLTGALTIGTPESLCAVRLLPLFTEYHNRYAGVELSLKFGGSYVFLDMLKDNQIDLAFYIERTFDMPELVSRLSWPEPIVLLASPGHPLAGACGVYPADLADQLLILTEQGCSYRARLLGLLAESGVAPKSTLESGNVQVMKQLAMGGIGIAFLPRVAVEEELAAGQLAELNWAGPAFGMMTHVVHHKDKWISPAINAFLSLAGEFLPATALHAAVGD